MCGYNNERVCYLNDRSWNIAFCSAAQYILVCRSNCIVYVIIFVVTAALYDDVNKIVHGLHENYQRQIFRNLEENKTQQQKPSVSLLNVINNLILGYGDEPIVDDLSIVPICE